MLEALILHAKEELQRPAKERAGSLEQLAPLLRLLTDIRTKAGELLQALRAGDDAKHRASGDTSKVVDSFGRPSSHQVRDSFVASRPLSSESIRGPCRESQDFLPYREYTWLHARGIGRPHGP